MSVEVSIPTSPAPRASRVARHGSRLGQLTRAGISASGILGFVFLWAPIIILIVFSFNASRFVSTWDGFSLRWYGELFKDAAMGAALKNSLIYLPIIIPDIAMAVMLLLFFVLSTFGLSLVTIIISHVAFNVSFVAVVVRARLVGFDRRLEEAAQDLGANELQTFWYVTLPLLMPGILGGALLAFTLSLDDFVITFFTSGVGSTTLPLRIYSMVKLGVTPEINAISTLLVLASMTLLMASLVLQRKGGGSPVDIL
jgi:spermidine/putrescine transport system permease protein